MIIRGSPLIGMVISCYHDQFFLSRHFFIYELYARPYICLMTVVNNMQVVIFPPTNIFPFLHVVGRVEHSAYMCTIYNLYIQDKRTFRIFNTLANFGYFIHHDYFLQRVGRIKFLLVICKSEDTKKYIFLD